MDSLSRHSVWMPGAVECGAVTDRRGAPHCFPVSLFSPWASWRCPNAFLSCFSWAAMVVFLALDQFLSEFDSFLGGSFLQFGVVGHGEFAFECDSGCLLYTSDAADE